MKNLYHNDNNIEFAVRSILPHKYFFHHCNKKLNIDAIRSVNNLSYKDAKLVVKILEKEWNQ